MKARTSGIVVRATSPYLSKLREDDLRGRTDRRSDRYNWRDAEAKAEFTARVLATGEIRWISGCGSRRILAREGDGRTQVAVADRQSERMGPHRTDDEDQREQHNPYAGIPAQGHQPSAFV